jgi:glycosyltransferase involved in cell wall biosynthesis
VFHFVGSDDEIELDRVVMHGRITNQQELVLFYSASDVCILPSLSENMSNVSVESLLCNTPVLCFDTTGLSEIIKTGINGYKAKKFDIDDLYKGLEYLRSFNPSVPLAETIPDFNPDICLKKYVDVYEKVIEKGK